MDLIIDNTIVELNDIKNWNSYIERVCERLLDSIKIEIINSWMNYSKVTVGVIKFNYRVIADMRCVKKIDNNPLDKYVGRPSDQLKQYFQSIGNAAISEYGLVNLSKKSARDFIFHSFNGLKAFGVCAVKEVLEQGKAIYSAKFMRFLVGRVCKA